MSGTKNILITGASGLIGSRLTELLLQKGYHVSHLSRSPRLGTVPVFAWDVKRGTMDYSALEGVDAIIHLAGTGIAEKPWTENRKREIVESRVQSTRLLIRELERRSHGVKTFLSASAIGFYGFGGTEWFDEESPAGDDFLASVTRRWEEESSLAEGLGIRVAKVRIGIVLADSGGALKAMTTPIKFHIGAPLGSGNQFISWIHLDDVCRLFIHLLENSQLSGAYNATAPEPATNRDFTNAVANVLGRRIWLPAIPEFVLKTLLGEMASLVLTGCRVSCDKARRSGFDHEYKHLTGALEALLKR